MLVSWVALRIQDRTRPSAPPFFVAAGGLRGLTLVSSVFSVDPTASFIDNKQLLLLAIVPAVYDIARGPRASSVADLIITVGAASALIGILHTACCTTTTWASGRREHYALHDVFGRPDAGHLRGGSRLIFGSRDRIWPALVMPALVVALGADVHAERVDRRLLRGRLLFILKDFRLTALLPVIVAVLFVMAPMDSSPRLTSTFDAQDPATRTASR